MHVANAGWCAVERAAGQASRDARGDRSSFMKMTSVPIKVCGRPGIRSGRGPEVEDLMLGERTWGGNRRMAVASTTGLAVPRGTADLLTAAFQPIDGDAAITCVAASAVCRAVADLTGLDG